MLACSSEITLRRLKAADLPAFQAYRNDPDVARYQSWATLTDEDARRFLSHMEQFNPLMQPGQWAQIGICETGSDLLIGDMGLFLSKDGTFAEMGITLASDHHRRGLGLAAAKLAIDLVWRESNALVIKAWGDQRNTGSIALMRKLGMIHVGTETSDITEEAFELRRPLQD